MRARKHKEPDYLKINPLGKPLDLIDDSTGFSLFESGAIPLYTAEQYGRESSSREDRPLITKRVSFANATLSPAIFVQAVHDRDFVGIMNVLNKIYEENNYLVGER